VLGDGGIVGLVVRGDCDGVERLETDIEPVGAACACACVCDVIVVVVVVVVDIVVADFGDAAEPAPVAGFFAAGGEISSGAAFVSGGQQGEPRFRLFKAGETRFMAVTEGEVIGIGGTT
jgi:hypothetical protein